MTKARLRIYTGLGVLAYVAASAFYAWSSQQQNTTQLPGINRQIVPAGGALSRKTPAVSDNQTSLCVTHWALADETSRSLTPALAAGYKF